MKILLIALNAKYIHSNPAVYGLRSCAAGCGEDIEIAEYTINQEESKILQAIYEKKPDIAAFSCYIWNIRLAGALMGDLGKLLPDIPIWCGGPEVSYDAPAFLRAHPEAAGVMAGEGEHAFKELVRFYALADREGKELKTCYPAHIPGISYRAGDTVIDNGMGKPADLLSIPFPYDGEEDFTNRIVYYESSRGCPFSCTYCLSSVEKGARLKSIGQVKRELDFFLELKTRQVKFIDRTFNCNHGHALSIWRYIAEHDNGITNFHFEIAADLLIEEELEVLSSMRPGLVQLEIGIQSVNEKTLAEVRRRTDIKRIKRAVKRLGEGQNINRHLDLIAGLPFEDYESFIRSFDEVYELRAEQLQLGFLKVLKGSPMRLAAADYGLAYTSEPPYEVLFNRFITYEELQKCKAAEEMLNLYYNSGQFGFSLPVLESAFERPFDMFLELAGYYKEKGYAMANPSRRYRYDILLEFAAERLTDANPPIAALMAQLLTLDLYAREKVKSRPSFAPSRKEKEEEIRLLYGRSDVRAALGGCEEGREKQVMGLTHMELTDCDLSRFVPGAPAGPCAVLFDYRNRSPVTGNAASFFFRRMEENT